MSISNNIHFVNLLKDELQISRINSPYISRMLLALNSTRDIQDIATIVAQTLIEMYASESKSKEMLIEVVQRVGIQNIKGAYNEQKTE